MNPIFKRTDKCRIYRICSRSRQTFLRLNETAWCVWVIHKRQKFETMISAAARLWISYRTLVWKTWNVCHSGKVEDVIGINGRAKKTGLNLRGKGQWCVVNMGKEYWLKIVSLFLLLRSLFLVSEDDRGGKSVCTACGVSEQERCSCLRKKKKRTIRVKRNEQYQYRKFLKGDVSILKPHPDFVGCWKKR